VVTNFSVLHFSALKTWSIIFQSRIGPKQNANWRC